MFELETEGKIKERILEKMPTNIDKAEGSLLYDTIAPVSIELAKAYIALEQVLQLGFAETSYGEFLERRANEFGVLRRKGTKATGEVTFQGSDGAYIPEGTLVQSEGGLRYVTTHGATITGGKAVVTIEAVAVGTQYNVPPLVIKSLPISVIGVTGVQNETPIAGGMDVESDPDLLKRLLLKVQTPTTSGNANHYLTWALEVDGVGDAKVFPTWQGGGTVKVVIINTDKKPADPDLIFAVTSHIEANRPIGAEVTVLTASEKKVKVDLTLQIANGYILNDVKARIQQVIEDYFKELAFKKNYISYAHLGSLILSIDGVSDYSSFKLNGATSNINIGEEEVPILDTLTITM